jgi:hypothetical protein
LRCLNPRGAEKLAHLTPSRVRYALNRRVAFAQYKPIRHLLASASGWWSSGPSHGCGLKWRLSGTADRPTVATCQGDFTGKRGLTYCSADNPGIGSGFCSVASGLCCNPQSAFAFNGTCCFPALAELTAIAVQASYLDYSGVETYRAEWVVTSPTKG